MDPQSALFTAARHVIDGGAQGKGFSMPFSPVIFALAALTADTGAAATEEAATAPAAATEASAAPDGAVSASPGGGFSLGSAARVADMLGGFELRLWTGAAVGAAPQIVMGAGGMPHFGLSGRLLWGFFEPEMVFGYGAFAGYGHSHLRVSIGAKLILAIDDARPFLWAGYSHIHETLFTDIMKDPIGTTLTTANSVTHRSGAELGAGILFPLDFPMFGSRYRVDAYVKATGMALPRLEKLLGAGDETSVPHDGYILFEGGFGFPVLST